MVTVEISVEIAEPNIPASGRRANFGRMATKMTGQSLKMRRLHGISALQKSYFFQVVKPTHPFERLKKQA